MAINRPSISKVARAGIAWVFGRFRPAQGLSKDETDAISSERVEFGNRFIAYCQAIQADEAQVVNEIRSICREITNDPNARMPSVEALAARVRAAFQARERPLCFGCTDVGGFYRFTGVDAPRLSPERGAVEWAPHGWLCLGHSEVANWFAHREASRRALPGVCGMPRGHVYPPPAMLLPRGAVQFLPPEGDEGWVSYTDGVNAGPNAAWARSFLRRAFQWEVGETLTPLFAQGRRSEDESWAGL